MLASWLRDRVARVVVGGKRSAEYMLRNLVFQGTVLGPGLWNIMYEDPRGPINACGFTEIVYADDLNAWRSFRVGISNAELIRQMEI